METRLSQYSSRPTTSSASTSDASARTLIWPQEGDPEPDLDRNIWLARDTPRMAEVLGTLPVMLAVASSDDPDGPMPLPVTVNIPNDHLQYAITWFLLAVVWAVMTGYLLWRIKRRID
jgi:surfeit locus 1 family protein